MAIRVYRDKDGELRLDLEEWMGGLRASYAQDATLNFLQACREHLEANEPDCLREIDALRTAEEIVESDLAELFPGV